MTQAEASALVAKLFAAFPFHRDNDELTAAVYVEQVAGLKEPNFALEAVNDLIGHEKYLPSIAQLREQYQAVSRRYPSAALAEPPVSPEQMAENVRQAKALVERLSGIREMA